jgi:PilZ domain
MTPISDRRQDERFDVVGAMWGVLELNEPARIDNVSVTGALVDSPVPAALDSSQVLHLTVDGQEIKVEAHVRHVRAIPTGRFEERFMIGLEFASPPLTVIHAIEQLGVERASNQADL